MDNKIDELISLVEDIKLLLIASLIRNGASQADIAKTLGVNQSSISRLFTKVNRVNSRK